MTVAEIVALDPNGHDFDDQVMQFLAQNVPYEYHMHKIAEECFEYGEVIMKALNKDKDHRPDSQCLLEEFSDLVLRTMLVSGHLWGDGDLEKGLDILSDKGFGAMHAKLVKMQTWLAEGRLYNMMM